MKRHGWIALAGALVAGLALSPAANAGSVASTVVVSQVYGGGGELNAPYSHDFVELFNESSSQVDLSNYSILYDVTPADQLWLKTDLSGTILPHRYYLVEEGSGGTHGSALPTPDATGTINMSESAGSVFVYNSQTTPTGAYCPLYNPGLADLVGYGKQSFPYCAETGNSNKTQAPAPSVTTSDLRRLGGCIDTNSNVADFITGTPDARNSASPKNTCAKEASKTTVTAKKTKSAVKATGTVTPNETGHTVKVSLLRKSGQKFKPVDTDTAKLNKSSKFSSTLKSSHPGTCEVTAKFGGANDTKASSAKTKPFSC